MNDFKLKLILSMLGGIVFSFIFITLTFVLQDEKVEYKKKPENRLGAVAESFKNR